MAKSVFPSLPALERETWPVSSRRERERGRGGLKLASRWRTTHCLLDDPFLSPLFPRASDRETFRPHHRRRSSGLEEALESPSPPPPASTFSRLLARFTPPARNPDPRSRVVFWP